MLNRDDSWLLVSLKRACWSSIFEISVRIWLMLAPCNLEACSPANTLSGTRPDILPVRMAMAAATRATMPQRVTSDCRNWSAARANAYLSPTPRITGLSASLASVGALSFFEDLSAINLRNGLISLMGVKRVA